MSETKKAIKVCGCKSLVSAKQLTKREKRDLAKKGMLVSLGALVVTGAMLSGRHHKGAKSLHIAAGVALVGASYWHHKLYTPASLCDNSEPQSRPSEDISPEPKAITKTS